MEVHPDLINTIDFSVDEVHMALMNLQKDKACGPDCVPAYLLKVGADFLAVPLSKLFQLSLSILGLYPGTGSQPTLCQFIKRVIAISHQTIAQLV